MEIPGPLNFACDCDMIIFGGHGLVEFALW